MRCSSPSTDTDSNLRLAVDQDWNVLDILVTFRRDAKAATRFFRQLLKGLRYVPQVMVIDKQAGYGVAHRRLIPSVEHRRSKYLNNWACPRSEALDFILITISSIQLRAAKL
jgi:putative transposase